MTVPASVADKDGGDWPPGLSQALPRAVQLRKSVIAMLWLIGGLCVVLLAFTILLGFLAVHRTSQLVELGVRAQGTVCALNVTRGKGGPGYRVNYRFTDPAPPSPNEGSQTGQAYVNEAQFRLLFLGGPVDVVFLPRRPDISLLDMTLVKAARDPWEKPVAAILVIGVVPTAGAFAFAWAYWRENRLLRWGLRAAATVRDVWTEKRGRDVITCARFEFLDSDGITREAVARTVGTASQQSVGFSTRSFAAGDRAVALYMTGDPAAADLYPLRLVTLAPKQPRVDPGVQVPPTG